MFISDVLISIKKYSLWFFLLLKRLIKKTGMWIISIVIIAATIMAQKYNKTDSSNLVNVGLIINNDDEISYKTAMNLINGDYSVNFYIAGSYDAMTGNILNNKDYCGYIFNDNLKERLDSGNIKECITLVKLSDDFLSSMLNEIVFAELFRVYGKDIAVGDIVKSGIFGEDTLEAAARIEERYSEYEKSSATFHLEFEDINEYQRSNSNDYKNTSKNNIEASLFSIRGVMAVVVAIAGLTGCVWWKNEEKQGIFKAMRSLQKYMGAFLYSAAAAFLMGIAAIIVIFITHSQIYGDIYEILKMLLYIIEVGIMGMLFCFIIRDRLFLTALIPVYAIVCFLACPVFVDLSTVIPALNYISRLLLPYYMMI